MRDDHKYHKNDIRHPDYRESKVGWMLADMVIVLAISLMQWVVSGL